MRILYIVDEDISTNSGVIQKIKTQIEIWERHGNSIKLISMRSKGWSCIIPDSKVLSVFENNSFLKVFNFIKIPALLQKEINLFKPEVIYSRLIIYRPFLVSVLKSRCNYVIELNTIDVEEFERGSKPMYYYHLLTRSFTFRNMSGFIAVTNEILMHKSFSKFRKRGLVIGNGIDTTKFKGFVRNKSNVSVRKDIVFIGSPYQEWHGLDKILYMANECPEYRFHIVGLSLHELRNYDGYENQNNIIIYNYQSEADAKEIIRRCQIGISTLALHRKQMNEACPLKSRQYLSQGLPMIVGYEDPDFSDQPFILNIGNYENNVRDNIQKIKDFVSLAVHLSPETIVEFAKENLEANKKETLRLDFIESIKNEE